MSHPHAHGPDTHGHGAAIALPPPAKAVLQRGLRRLLRLSRGATFQPTVSQRYPLPLALAVYGRTPAPAEVRRDVTAGLRDDPVSVLEYALVLLELIESRTPTTAAAVPDDAAFLSECFQSKRLNGWIATLGGGDRAELLAAIGARWQFKFVGGDGGGPRGPLYVLLNMLARYGFVYGRIEPGDSHALGHFIEDFTPGLLICRRPADDLDVTLALAATKLGVPAIVPGDYPFSLGRTVRTDAVAEMVDGIIAFPNIRRLLRIPEIPPLPEYCDAENLKTEFASAGCWGDTPESFCILRKGPVRRPGNVRVTGKPSGPLGVILTVQGRPLDAFDRQYIEARSCRTLSMIRGLRASLENGRLRIDYAAGIWPDARRIGETLVAAIRHEFPKLARVSVELMFSRRRLAAMAPRILAERRRRARAIAGATEERMARFVTCIGCSPFAPDHVCILTPQRPPQCGRAFEQIKTGALYDYDDLTNIHHRRAHAAVNSFGTCPKGRPIDAKAGEWSGVNAAAARLTGGRTRRVQLHSLAKAPHTGCGCFRLILFRMAGPVAGVGIMDRAYKGAAPDGRTWRDLHYALGGKQAVGLAGATPAYLRSAKFLAGDGGWACVVWVTPRIAETMGAALPASVRVGPGDY